MDQIGYLHLCCENESPLGDIQLNQSHNSVALKAILAAPKRGFATRYGRLVAEFPSYENMMLESLRSTALEKLDCAKSSHY